MAQDGISLTQQEIDLIMNGVRDDNERNEKKADGEAGVALSQAELDALFSGRQPTGTTVKAEPAHDTSKTITAQKSDIPENKQKSQIAAEKIAARKSQAAELLKKINAQSPKEIIVVYGKAKSTGADVDSFKQGTVIELNRPDKSAVDILCDGKLIARGFAGKSHGKAAVKITTVFQQ